MSTVRILGVVDEDPFDAQTWSGSSRYFFHALKGQDALHDAISAEPSRAAQWICKMQSFHPNMNKWKFKYHLNTGYYHQMTQTARQNLARVDASRYDTILQVGAWFDMTGINGKRVVSYHDGNLARLLGSPYGHPRIRQSWIQKALRYERNLYQRLDLIFTMSRWLADSFCHDFGVEPGKVHPIGAGINLPRIREIRDKSYEAPLILFVGKNFTRKGGEVLLEAFRTVKREIPEAELIIIGPELESPPPGVQCKGFVSKLTEEGLEELLEAYQHASVFVLPSLYEPFGVAFVEAMAHRLPCIGTNICAMPEIIQHGVTGYVVPPRDPAALARYLLMLLKEPDQCREFGNAGYERYRTHYTWEAVAAHLCEILNSRA